MKNYRIAKNNIIVDCSSLHFGPFSVVVLNDENEHDFYLRHKKYGICLFMFGMPTANNYSFDDLASIALSNAPDYIPDFIRQCFSPDE